MTLLVLEGVAVTVQVWYGVKDLGEKGSGAASALTPPRTRPRSGRSDSHRMRSGPRHDQV